MNNVIAFRPKETPLDDIQVQSLIKAMYESEYGRKKLVSVLLNSLEPVTREYFVREAIEGAREIKEVFG